MPHKLAQEGLCTPHPGGATAVTQQEECFAGVDRGLMVLKSSEGLDFAGCM